MAVRELRKLSAVPERNSFVSVPYNPTRFQRIDACSELDLNRSNIKSRVLAVLILAPHINVERRMPSAECLRESAKAVRDFRQIFANAESVRTRVNLMWTVSGERLSLLRLSGGFVAVLLRV
jgi:hypothetical protein